MPTFPILLSREFDFPLRGRTQNLGKKSKKGVNTVPWLPPPAFFPPQCTAGSEVFSSAVRWVSSPGFALASQLPLQLLLPPIRVALASQRRSGGGQGHHQSACQA